MNRSFSIILHASLAVWLAFAAQCAEAPARISKALIPPEVPIIDPIKYGQSKYILNQAEAALVRRDLPGAL
ncbi:MAG: hypothetical protein HY042_01225, partial [Spirochaetia bacterium]|nr:hypothetical protein [Spirochaetia bacterium]